MKVVMEKRQKETKKRRKIYSLGNGYVLVDCILERKLSAGLQDI